MEVGFTSTDERFVPRRRLRRCSRHPSTLIEKAETVRFVHDDNTVDLEAAAAHLRSLPEVSGQPVGVLGYCQPAVP
jgi:hypothetical protein